MRDFIKKGLELANTNLDVSAVIFSNEELTELVQAINKKFTITTLIIENSAINFKQASILAKLERVSSIVLDGNDIGFSDGFKELCMNRYGISILIEMH